MDISNELKEIYRQVFETNLRDKKFEEIKLFNQKLVDNLESLNKTFAEHPNLMTPDLKRSIQSIEQQIELNDIYSVDRHTQFENYKELSKKYLDITQKMDSFFDIHIVIDTYDETIKSTISNLLSIFSREHAIHKDRLKNKNKIDGIIVNLSSNDYKQLYSLFKEKDLTREITLFFNPLRFKNFEIKSEIELFLNKDYNKKIFKINTNPDFLEEQVAISFREFSSKKYGYQQHFDSNFIAQTQLEVNNVVQRPAKTKKLL